MLRLNGSIRSQPHNPIPSHPINKQILPTEKRLPNSLTLRLLHHPTRTPKKSILAYIPLLARPINPQRHDIPEQRRCQRHFPGTCERGLHHRTAREELLHADFGFALELDGRGHVDHGTGFRLDGFALRELEVESGVGVAVFDCPGYAVEVAGVARFGRRGLVGWLVELLLLAVGWLLLLLVVLLLVIALGLSVSCVGS